MDLRSCSRNWQYGNEQSPWFEYSMGIDRQETNKHVHTECTK